MIFPTDALNFPVCPGGSGYNANSNKVSNANQKHSSVSTESQRLYLPSLHKDLLVMYFSYNIVMLFSIYRQRQSSQTTALQKKIKQVVENLKDNMINQRKSDSYSNNRNSVQSEDSNDSQIFAELKEPTAKSHKKSSIRAKLGNPDRTSYLESITLLPYDPCTEDYTIGR